MPETNAHAMREEETDLSFSSLASRHIGSGQLLRVCGGSDHYHPPTYPDVGRISASALCRSAACCVELIRSVSE